MTLPSPLLIVSDRRVCRGPLVPALAACVRAGARWIWLRDRDLPPPARAALARDLIAAAGPELILSVGADVALAVALDSAGVHLPSGASIEDARRRLGRNTWVGVSAHHPDEVRRAREDGADYATLSPIFASASKPGYGPALGLDALARAAAFGLPILALGGIDAGSIGDCVAAGACGAARCSAAFSQRTIQRALQ